LRRTQCRRRKRVPAAHWRCPPVAYEDLIKRLRCPADRGELEHYDQVVLACKQCGRAYPIRDGIPIMLVDDQVQAEGAAALETVRREEPEQPEPERSEPDAGDEDDQE